MKWESHVLSVVDDKTTGKWIVGWCHTDGTNKVFTDEKVTYYRDTKHETWLEFMKKHNLKDDKNEHGS